MTPDAAIDMLRTLAAQNDGWLTSYAYYHRAPKGSPTHTSLYRIFGVTSWKELCDVAGIAQTHADTLPEVLNETQIESVLANMLNGGGRYQLAHRQQVAAYCLRKVAAELGTPAVTGRMYRKAIVGRTLYGITSIEDAFGSWNKALVACGLTVTMAGGGKPQKGREARDQQVMLDTYEGKWPANWRTLDWPLHTLEPVTEVTTVYRHATVAEYGLKYTETRMVLR